MPALSSPGDGEEHRRLMVRQFAKQAVPFSHTMERPGFLDGPSTFASIA
jgi:hypothetical protein